MLLEESRETISGAKSFYQLSIYERKLEENGKIEYNRVKLLTMEGQLRSFIESAGDTWPEPEVPPALQ